MHNSQVAGPGNGQYNGGGNGQWVPDNSGQYHHQPGPDGPGALGYEHLVGPNGGNTPLTDTHFPFSIFTLALALCQATEDSEAMEDSAVTEGLDLTALTDQMAPTVLLDLMALPDPLALLDLTDPQALDLMALPDPRDLQAHWDLVSHTLRHLV